MAEKIFTNVRLGLKVDTLENWKSSSLVLKRGEVAFATVAAEAGTGLTEPVVMMKIGDGEKTFSQLGFDFYAKASDVLAAAKTEAGLTAFVNNVIANAGIATNSAMQELAGRVTTAEGKITSLEGKMTAVEGKAAANESAIAELDGLVGDKAVATQISEAIAALDLANTYEKKGEAAKVETALNTYKTSNDAAVQKNATDIAGEITRAKAAEEANANAIAAIKDGTTIDSFADVEGALAGKEASGAAAQALIDAKAYADGLAGNYDAKGAAAQALTDAKAYADGLAGNYDAAGSAAAAEAAAKKHADDELERLVGDKTVNAQITEYVTGLKLSETYDAKGAAAAAETAAKGHADGLNSAMNTRVEALEAIDHSHANAAELDKIADGDVAKWNAAEQNAKDYADDLDEAMDLRMQAVEAKLGTGEGGVDAQIEAAVAAEAKLREDADTALSNRVKAIEDDYLKAADKTALQDQITELDGLVGDKAVSEQITDVTDPLAARVKAVEDDYLKAADKTELEGKITTNANAIERLTNGVSAEEVDGVNDLIQYVKDHGAEVTGMKGDIKANADAIDAIEKDYLKAADKTELEGKITAAQNAADKAQGEVDALEGVVATKAAQTDLEALAGRVTTVEGDLNTESTGLKARLTQAEADIDALEAKVGDKTVAEQITAITNPLDERIDALEAIDHSHANAAELDKFVDGDKAKLDSAVQTVTAAATSGLKATRTGNDIAIEIDESVTFIFDCGTSAV